MQKHYFCNHQSSNSHMKLHHIIASALCLWTIYAEAEAPAGYYSSLKGKSDAALKTALFEIINPHTQVSSYTALPDYFKKTDVRPGTNYWWDMYSNMNVETNLTFGTYMNREHSLPKSWWGGLTNIPAYVDLNHLYPAEAVANQRKSNYPLGEIAAGQTPYYTNGVVSVGTGVNSGGAKYVFEPSDEYKGDFARTYFYMVTCYQNLNWVTTWQVMNGTYPSLQSWAIELLLKWHEMDPVSEKELNRNEEVYKIQGNRNPFIDDPELVQYIWGNKKGQGYTPGASGEPTGTPTLITPPNGLYLDFSQVAVGHSTTSMLQFKSENCSGYFSLLLTGANKSYFTISDTKVQTSASNSVAGSWITVTYSPTSVGTHTARLVITDGNLPEGSRVVELKAECFPVPTLTKLTASEASDVTHDSYEANWLTPPDNEVVDSYVVTVKRFLKSGGVETHEIEAESNSAQITGFDEASYDTYTVQSVRLGIRSEASNAITVTPTAAIDEILVDSPLAVETFEGGLIRFRCGEPHYDVTIYDIAGRQYITLPVITDYAEITLPAGAYFVTTRNYRKPIKILAF